MNKMIANIPGPIVTNYNLIIHVIMVISVLLGSYVRFTGIGVWPLAVDEYYIAKSVENIISSGLPAYQYGGYYTRGILYQYLLVPALFLDIPAETALRVLSTVFNLLAIPAIYLLGKRISGSAVACVAVFIFSISLWEIEFSRFGRMYAPFQTIFVWYLLFLHRVIKGGGHFSKTGMYLFSMLSLFVWEGGILLVSLNFLHLFFDKNKNIYKDVLVGSFLLLIAYVYISIDFRIMNSGVQLPSDLNTVVAGINASSGPDILWKTLSQNNMPWMIGAGLMLLASLCMTTSILFKSDVQLLTRLGLSAAIILSNMNLFSVVTIFSVMLLLFGWVDLRSLRSRSTLLAFLTITGNLIFWVLYCLNTDVWYSIFPAFEQEVVFKKIMVILFKYPDIWNKVIFAWYSVMPVFSIMLGVVFVIGVILATTAKNDKVSVGLNYLAIILIYLICCVGAINTSYISTRYTFFLYPVVVLFSTIVLHKLVKIFISNSHLKALVSGILMAAVIWVSEDFGLNHMLYIDSMEINYRMDYDEKIAEHYYTRADYKTPAEYINHNIEVGHIVITSELTPEYYLEQLDYVYRDHKHGEFSAVSTSGGKRERWTGANLIYREAELYNLIKKAKSTVWMIASKKTMKWHEDQIAIYQKYSDKIVYTSIDDAVVVYRIDRPI